MSITKNLTGEIYVKGNFKNILQSYNIKYYEPEVNYPLDKIWLYLNGTDSETKKPRTIRSLCFDNPEALRKLITELTKANLFILSERLMNYSEIKMTFEYKRRLLESILLKVKEDVIKSLKPTQQLTSLSSPHQVLHFFPGGGLY